MWGICNSNTIDFTVLLIAFNCHWFVAFVLPSFLTRIPFPLVPIFNSPTLHFILFFVFSFSFAHLSIILSHCCPQKNLENIISSPTWGHHCGLHGEVRGRVTEVITQRKCFIDAISVLHRAWAHSHQFANQKRNLLLACFSFIFIFRAYYTKEDYPLKENSFCGSLLSKCGY